MPGWRCSILLCGLLVLGACARSPAPGDEATADEAPSALAAGGGGLVESWYGDLTAAAERAVVRSRLALAAPTPGSVADAELAVARVRELGLVWAAYAEDAGRDQAWIAERLAAVDFQYLMRLARHLRDQRVMLDNARAGAAPPRSGGLL